MWKNITGRSDSNDDSRLPSGYLVPGVLSTGFPFLCSHHTPGSWDYYAQFTGAEREAPAGSGSYLRPPSWSVARLGLRLRSLPCQSRSLPAVCPPPTISGSLVTLELLLRVVSTPSLEAVTQLLAYQMLPGVLDSWTRCEAGLWAGRILLAGEGTALLVLDILIPAGDLGQPLLVSSGAEAELRPAAGGRRAVRSQEHCGSMQRARCAQALEAFSA